MTFVHFNVHSKASMLYGSANIKELVNRAKVLKQPAIALTDYSNMFNVVNFYREAVGAGVKPIIGVDFCFCEDAKEHKIQRMRQFSHITLIAENDIGLQNIARLVSLANTEDYYYYNPRIDFGLLEKHKEGVICLTGGTSDGVIASCLIDRTNESGEVTEPAAIFKAKGLVRRFLKIFDKDHFFLEIQSTGLSQQAGVNSRTRNIAKEYGLLTIPTNSVHYVEQHNAEAHKTLLAMNADQYSRITTTDFTPEEYYLKSREELELCDFTKQELDNTLVLAERCSVNIDLKKRRLPSYKFIPDNLSAMEYLTQLANNGLKDLGIDPESGNKFETYQNRLNRELLDIGDMGFADYFLIVHDVISWVRNQGILLGLGRGSAGGSLVSYALGITEIDPLEYGLIWERFLNKGRGGLPDIDSDIPRSQRQKVLNYVRERFGARNVAQLVTLSGLQARAVLKEVFRVFNMDFDEANKITALVPAKSDEHVPITLEEAIETTPELKKYYDQYTPWFKIALSLEGCYKSTGVHASAVVISDVPFDESSYPMTRTKDGDMLFGWDMNTVDSLSLLKLDILGLTTLDDIQETMRLVKKRRGIDLCRKTMPLNDVATWHMIGQGFTVGIFQIEKQLGRTWSKNLQPESIEQLSDLVSIIRPGPMDSGMHTAYRGVKNKSEQPQYIHPKLESIMTSTFSALLYQEQVIEICKQLASMSLIDADSVRKAMGKKKPEEMKKWKEVFVNGCAANGIDVVTAEEIWGYIEKFAGYGFNKSHGVGYALLAYETAYLKANYTIEFLCAKLKHSDSHPDKFEQMSALVYDGKLFNIEITPPRVSQGNKDFDIIDDTHIAFGLTALKGVGAASISDLIKIGKENKTLDDILWRVMTTKTKISTAVLTALIRGGAFDDLEEHRIEAQSRFKLLASLTPNECELVQSLLSHQDGKPDWIRVLRAVADEAKAPVIKERFKVKVPDVRRRIKIRESLQEFDARELFDTKAQRIAWEQFYLGISLSGSEADIYNARDKCIDLVRDGEPNSSFDIAVCVDGVREIICKKGKSAGQSMAFVTASDKTYIMDNIVVFPSVFNANKAIIDEGSVLRIRGRIDDRGSLIADKVERLK